MCVRGRDVGDGEAEERLRGNGVLRETYWEIGRSRRRNGRAGGETERSKEGENQKG